LRDGMALKFHNGDFSLSVREGGEGAGRRDSCVGGAERQDTTTGIRQHCRFQTPR
jgi:hypothetical protein